MQADLFLFNNLQIAKILQWTWFKYISFIHVPIWFVDTGSAV